MSLLWADTMPRSGSLRTRRTPTSLPSGPSLRPSLPPLESSPTPSTRPPHDAGEQSPTRTLLGLLQRGLNLNQYQLNSEDRRCWVALSLDAFLPQPQGFRQIYIIGRRILPAFPCSRISQGFERFTVWKSRRVYE